MPKYSKPCPQCGGTIYRMSAGTADKMQPWPVVCAKCRDYIDLGKAAEAREKQEKALEDYNLATGEDWRIGSVADCQLDREQVKKLGAALSAALIAVTPASLEQDGYGGDEDHYLPHRATGWERRTRRVRMTPKAAAAVRRFHNLLRETLEVEYRLGVEQGKNLLKQLALGQIGADEFDSVKRR